MKGGAGGETEGSNIEEQPASKKIKKATEIRNRLIGIRGRYKSFFTMPKFNQAFSGGRL
jgi:hypothetical protein